MSSFADSAEPSRAEAALRESEQPFRPAFLQAEVGIAQTSVEGEWLFLSDRFCEVLGYTGAELREKTLPDVTYADDRESLLTEFRKLLTGEAATWSMGVRCVRKGGATIWTRLSASLVRDRSNLPHYVILVIEDATDRIQAERALQDTERRLALAQSAAQLGLWDWDLRTNVHMTYGEYPRLYGVASDRPSFTYEEWLGLVHPDDHERVQEQVRESIEQTHVWDTEFRVVWPDGSVHWLLGKGRVFLDHAGHPVRMTGVNLDITERKRAEGALRESEERFRNMANTAPVMIWIAGPDKRCTFFNKGWLDFTNRTLEQELHNGWAANVHPDDLDQCYATYSSAFDTRRGFQMEYRLRRADGEYRWILGNGVPLHSEGEFAGFISSCIDVTEGKLIEERLRTSEARLTDAQRLAKIGCWERSIEAATAVYWSDEMFRIFGRPIGGVPSYPDFISSVHPDDREKIRATVQEACSGTAPVIAEFRIVRPDGELRWVRSVLEPIRNNQGAPGRMRGATQDVTEQVKARELLHESEERLKSAQRLAHVGNWDWDVKENRLFWSEEVHRIFGKPPNYAPDYAGFLEAIQPQDRERVDRKIRDILEGQTPQFQEFQISRPNGDVRTIACISELMRDDAGAPLRMVGACLDVTDQKRAEAALRRSLDEIAHLNRVAAMGELTASLAHELNQPLAAILSNAQAASRFLSSELPDLAQARECLADIVADDKRAGEVINRLRGLLRKGESRASLVDLNEVVSDTIRLVGNDALMRQSSLKFEPVSGLPRVPGDRIQIYQVVLNLVMNALKRRRTARREIAGSWCEPRNQRMEASN